MPPRSRRSFARQGLSPVEAAALRSSMANPAPRQTPAQIDAAFAATRAQSAALAAARDGGYSQRYANNAFQQARTASPDTLQAWAGGRDPVYAAAARPFLAAQPAPRAASPTAARSANS